MNSLLPSLTQTKSASVTDEEIQAYVSDHIGKFHLKRIESLGRLKLKTLLKRKNPYLFKCKHITVVTELIGGLLNAHLISQEETIFGDFLEGLAIFVANSTHGGFKSAATGIDLEFSIDDVRYIVSIKSGPNWGNSSQIKKMKENFITAKRLIRQGDSTTRIVAVNGCCYGQDKNPDKGDYYKYCGQAFWELMSGDTEFYKRIIEPLAHRAEERNVVFQERFGSVVNKFSSEFMNEFCDKDGLINWSKLVAFSSAKQSLPG